jgi:hypothetical protein
VSVIEQHLDAVLNHRRHQAAQPVLAGLIQQLRECANVKDGYEFQQVLLGHLDSADTARDGCNGAVKRMRCGKPPQAGAPEPQSGQDPARQETWELERDVCERLVRQFKCVGDALAWRVFGFQRKHIIALSQNQPPGGFAGKAGRAAELAHIDRAYHEDGKFALLHDLTNCLRIDDVTIFGNDGTPTTIEVKTNPNRTRSAQNRRSKAAAAAVHGNAPLPGPGPSARLYDIDVPYASHLNVLRRATERASRDGIFTTKLPGDRVLLVTDVYGYSAGGWTGDDWPATVSRRLTAALRRASLGDDMRWHVAATSYDSVSQDPARVPFAIYPLPPIACARIIGDYALFQVHTSGPALAESLRDAGIDARWVLRPGHTQLRPGQVVMEMTASAPIPAGIVTRGRTATRTKTLQMRRRELDIYLIELFDQAAWIKGIRHLLNNDQFGDGQPWPHYRNEHRVWA